ncbi:DUF262 domain-containing protein [Variovorax saccharolyticus]|uniref:DUF262 domain-containing protein n=1 Tax=Variovorax saccharolyticus TaxID=3053516 RepID=UPI002577DC71|nr:DUF262 domain-containing HNH endonuclease family protein [Variovorax sp. J31P216]MDM0029593.1 DUF262 domain-containing HNH endonuclease family protein [Variovorax sp. J31P216]
MTRMDVTSSLYSLADITAQNPNWHFNVPIYQRLYVWGPDQVLTLLNDLINAHDRRESLFFLGGVLMVEQPGKHGRHFDLIDGQQRLTTLWMLCQTWGAALEPFLRVRQGDEWRPRLSFAIRPEVNDLLRSLLSHEPTISASSSTSDAGIERMGQAMTMMRSALTKRGQDLTESSDLQDRLHSLADFVFHKVKFIVTTVPRTTDLNKLFEVINNRGVQLQHHEILKARVLESLTETERAEFAVLWDACADMDNYVERSLSGISTVPAHELQALHGSGRLGDGATVRQRIAQQHRELGSHQTRSLAAILTGSKEAEVGGDGVPDAEVNHTARVRSIIGFPLLLEHALRIWLFEQGRADLPRVLDRELLSLFEKHFLSAGGSEAASDRAKDARSFIDLLWRLRVLFDEHVIKWVDQGSQEVHLISRISVSTSKGRSYITRSRDTDSHRGLSLLQSMLYHSQEITTHYWLTPFMLHLHRHASKSAESHFVYLQHLDNHLLGCEPEEPLAVRTASFMADPWQERPLIHQEALSEPQGVGFPHYWFYKMEFVLWDQRATSTPRWQDFRFTAKNSVEHISPQTPTERDADRVDQALDCFGNLALVSRSLNSEYGNMPFNEKRRRFLNINRETVDSLKMDVIYRPNDRWGDELALDHQSEMIRCFETYVDNCLGRARAAQA